MRDAPGAEGHAPLSEATYFVLLSLSREPRHGYAIMKDVAALSEERVKLSTGTLYGIIKRLLEDGWIRPVEEPGGDTDGRGRRAYTLTQNGRRAFEAEVARLASLVAAAGLRGAAGLLGSLREASGDGGEA